MAIENKDQDWWRAATIPTAIYLLFGRAPNRGEVDWSTSAKPAISMRSAVLANAAKVTACWNLSGQIE